MLGLLLGLVAAGAGYAVWMAKRLHRLHARVDAAWGALDDALLRRAVPAQAALVPSRPGAADGEIGLTLRLALQAGPVDREARENRLVRALRSLEQEDVPAAVALELLHAARRVAIARAIHNAAVADTLLLRERRLVRLLRLAGHRPAPTYFDIDDASPPDVRRAA